MNNRVFLFYPPGGLYQRGEDRSQANLEASTSNAMRACNDLGYMASVLRNNGAKVFLRDYPSERLSIKQFYNDIEVFNPDSMVLSATFTTLRSDIDLVNNVFLNTSFRGKVIIKSAFFFDAPDELIDGLDLRNIDILVGGEIDWIIGDLVAGEKDYSNIPGIIYKNKEGEWKKTDFTIRNENLDLLPFPARDLMKNELYVRPDTNEPMATIQIARGCPGGCIYCLEPIIGGNKVRTRTPENVFEEIKECYYSHGINNFFFRSGTFTINKEWVLKLCELIKKSEIYGKIEYTANSRVKPISREVLSAMKDTGCFAIAFGFETGSKETMKRIGKGATVEDCYRAAFLAKQVGITVLGFYMMGFAWENKNHLRMTKRMIFDLDTDFIEIHLALPFYGTKYNKICKDIGTLDSNLVGKDVFHESTSGTIYMSAAEVTKFRDITLLQYHLRPAYIIRRIKDSIRNPRKFVNYFHFGIRMLKNILIYHNS